MITNIIKKFPDMALPIIYEGAPAVYFAAQILRENCIPSDILSVIIRICITNCIDEIYLDYDEYVRHKISRCIRPHNSLKILNMPQESIDYWHDIGGIRYDDGTFAESLVHVSYMGFRPKNPDFKLMALDHLVSLRPQVTPNVIDCAWTQ